MSSDRVKINDDVYDALKVFRGERNDRNEKYLVIGYEDKNTLCVIASGDGGLDDAAVYCTGEAQRYVLLRKIHVVDVAMTVKFAYVDWTPETLKPMRRALLSTHKGQVEDLLKPFHVSLQATVKSELDESVIYDKIGFSSGTKQHTVDRVTAFERQDVLQVKKEKRERIVKSGNATAKVATASRQLSIQGEEELRAGILDVRSDDNPTVWVLAGYANDKTIEYLGVGSGGIDELSNAMNEERVYYGYFRETAQVDKSVTVKFCFVKVVADSLSPVKKAKYATHMGFVTSVFEPFHEQFLLSSPKELTYDMVLDRIHSTMGTKSHVLSHEEALAKTRVKTEQTHTNLVPVESEAQLQFVDEGAFRGAIADVRNDASEVTWMVAEYVGSDKLGVLGTGAGTVQDVARILSQDSANFALLRVEDVIDKSVTVKFVYIKWMPTLLNNMTRARLSTKKGMIDREFMPFHVDFFVESLDELSEEAIHAKVTQVSGSVSRVRD